MMCIGLLSGLGQKTVDCYDLYRKRGVSLKQTSRGQPKNKEHSK